MTNKTNTILLSLLLAVAVIGLVINLQPKEEVVPVVNNNFGEVNEWFTGGSATEVTVGTLTTGTTAVIAANSGRQYARIQNMGNNKVYCLLSNTTSTLAVGHGIEIQASSSAGNFYDITPNNLYKGIVRCIAATAATIVSVTEK